jgi:hypothetical protein
MNEFNTVRARFSVVACLVLSALVLPAETGWAAQGNAMEHASQPNCTSLQPTSYPKVSISNGLLNAEVYLPDAKDGYYRGTRFDWSGVVGCLAYKGHTYFGVWFQHYDPFQHDAISGPVEEFRSSDGALNYDQAKPGELFVKPGVGILRKVDDSPYKFTAAYPLVNGGKWTVRTRPDGVSFRQDLRSQLGIAYVYKKTLKLEKGKPYLILEHELKNTGTKTIDTEVYDHDFFMLDGAPTGPGMVVRFPFEPKADQALENGGKIDGKELVYQQELQPGQTVFSFLTGFSNDPADYDITVENRNTGVGVEQTSNVPISRFNFWSIRTTICPEAYVHLVVAPGQTASWTIRYRFYAK